MIKNKQNKKQTKNIDITIGALFSASHLQINFFKFIELFSWWFSLIETFIFAFFVKAIKKFTVCSMFSALVLTVRKSKLGINKCLFAKKSPETNLL